MVCGCTLVSGGSVVNARVRIFLLRPSSYQLCTKKAVCKRAHCQLKIIIHRMCLMCYTSSGCRLAIPLFLGLHGPILPFAKKWGLSWCLWPPKVQIWRNSKAVQWTQTGPEREGAAVTLYPWKCELHPILTT